uniref:Conserved oligomeric Golgi complex subunit 1 n=1 Tax=Panagrolaimus superbus TaxID=310955 RepID=A0A914Y702_9BILA
MVGRRYRDVLDASDTIRRLTEIASDLGNNMKEIRKISKNLLAGDDSKHSIKKETLFKFGLLLRLEDLLENPNDPLGDVFTFLFTENLHRGVSIESQSFKIENVDINLILRPLGDRLITFRLALCDRLEHHLGEQTDWEEVSGILAALAFLNQSNLQDLLEIYLKARKNFITKSLESSTTLISVIEMIKSTAECVDDVFGKGRAIISALDFVTSSGWCPEPINVAIADCQFCYLKQLKIEVTRINSSYTKSYAEGLSDVFVGDKCTKWIEGLCEAVKSRVKGMCDFFEHAHDVIEFIYAINDIFSTEWPTVSSNSLVYQKLFGSSLIERYKALITKEMHYIEAQLLSNASKVQTNPPPLFQKRGARFDSLLASGVSQELYEVIQKSFNRLSDLLSNTNRYISMGKEENVQELLPALAEAALEMTKRIATLPKFNSETSGSENLTAEKNKWLSRFRIYLALVQHEPSVLCQCMGRNTELIIQCNKLLHSAAENALCNFMNILIDESYLESKIPRMSHYVSDPMKFLDLAQQLEKYKLPNSESIIEIPTQLSRFYFSFLFSICQKTNTYSVGHLFTRNVTSHVSKVLGELLSKSLIETASACSAVSVICTQILFDCKSLFFMFLDKGFVEAASIIENKLDPFNKAVLTEPLSKNAKIFVQRTSMLFGQLQIEPSTSSKDIELAPSFTSLIDIAPIIPNIPRLPLIPGMSVIEHQEERKSVVAEEIKPKKKAQPTATPTDVLGGLLGARPDIKNLYDKFSTNWFKN